MKENTIAHSAQVSFFGSVLVLDASPVACLLQESLHGS
jgi:hypothetical protein